MRILDYIYIFVKGGHACKIVKPKEQDIEAFFADIKTFAMRIQDLALV